MHIFLKRQVLSLLLLGALGIGLGGCKEAEFIARLNSRGELFSLEIPKGWQGKRTVGAMLTLENPERTAVIKIMISKIPEGTIFQKYVVDLASDDNYGQGNVVERGRKTIDGVDGFWEIRRVEKLRDGKIAEIKTLNYYLDKDGWLYVLQVIADKETISECLPIVREFVNSFRFKVET